MASTGTRTCSTRRWMRCTRRWRSSGWQGAGGGVGDRVADGGQRGDVGGERGGEALISGEQSTPGEHADGVRSKTPSRTSSWRGHGTPARLLPGHLWVVDADHWLVPEQALQTSIATAVLRGSARTAHASTGRQGQHSDPAVDGCYSAPIRLSREVQFKLDYPLLLSYGIQH